MTTEFTPSEVELLHMLAEEAGEIVQAVTKLLRHGKVGIDFSTGEQRVYDNLNDLTCELDDIVAIISKLDEREIVGSHWSDPDVLQDVWERKLPFTHWQLDSAPTER